MSKQVGSVTDPDTGDQIEIYQINPDDQCYNKYLEWFEQANEPSGEIDQELEKLCSNVQVKITYDQYIADWDIYEVLDDCTKKTCQGYGGNNWEGNDCKYNVYADARGPTTEIEKHELVDTYTVDMCTYEIGCYTCACFQEYNKMMDSLGQAYQKAMEKVKDTDSWPSAQREEILPVTFVSALGLMGGGFVKEVTVDRADDYEGGVTGVKLCITSTCTDVTGTETEDVQQVDAKWGDKVTLQMPSGEWDQYQIYENPPSGQLCQPDNPSTPYEQWPKAPGMKELRHFTGKTGRCVIKIKVIGYLTEEE